MDPKAISKTRSLPFERSRPNLSLLYLWFLLQSVQFVIYTINAIDYSHKELLSTSSGNGGDKRTHKRVKFHSMFAMGDSLTDTGNMLFVMEAHNFSQMAPIINHMPYGETFFHKPSGRYSDGRLIVDLFVEKLGASKFLSPSLPLLNQTGNGTQGASDNLVNFAVAGATALTTEYFNATYNITPYTSYSLSRQLQWLLNTTVSKDKKALSKALIFVGAIGGNDYNYAFGNHVSLNRIHDLVPNVIAELQNAFQAMLESGIKHIVVQSAYPMGCIPLYKNTYPNATRDEFGCLQEINSVVHQHNMLLSELLDNLTTHYNNNVQLIFMDSVKAFMDIYTNPAQYGFTYRERPCYDLGNYFLNLPMNVTTVQACDDPSTYIIWDGVHPTEAMNKAVLNLFYTEGYVKPYPNFLTSRSQVIA